MNQYKRVFHRFRNQSQIINFAYKLIEDKFFQIKEIKIKPYLQFCIKDNLIKSKQANFKNNNNKGHNKIVGLMVTWNNFEFFKYSIQQALDFCDELLLIEGCHSNRYPKRSTDGTVEFIEQIKGHPKLRIFDFNFKKKYVRYDITQLHVRMAALKKSNLLKSRNWYIVWDDDNFFFQKDLLKLRKIMRDTTYDTLVFKERRFIYNFRFNTFSREKSILYRGAGQIDRIKKETCFKGFKTMVLPRLYYGKTKRYNNILYLDDIITFHYPYVKLPERIKARWEMSVEKGIKKSEDLYEKYMSVKWKKDEDIFKYKDTINYINGQSNLNIYDGNHPKILDTHPWRHISDIRE